MDVDQTFSSHRNLIRKRAFHYHKTSSIPFEECEAEGNLIFCKAVSLYDEERAKFSTFLYMRLNQGFIQFIQKWNLQLPKYYERLEQVENTLQYASEEGGWIEDFWIKVSALSEESEMVVICILESSEDLFNAIQTKPPKMVRGVLIKYLREKKGWSWPKIWRVFREIKHWVKRGGD